MRFDAEGATLGDVARVRSERDGLDRRWWALPRLRGRLVAVALASFTLTIATFALRSVELPHDREYAAVIFLMWPRGALGWDAVGRTVAALELVCFAIPLVLLTAALLPAWLLRSPPAFVRWVPRHALTIPLLLLATTALSRLISNGVYAAAPLVTWDLTPPIATLEASLIEAIQRSLETPWLSYACALVYAGVWLLTLLAAVPLLILRGRDEGAARLAIGWVAAAIAAAPMFLLLPVYEPWAFNPLYGYAGPGATQVRFLGTAGSAAELHQTAVQLRLATASCFPSLHVGLPVLAAAICFQQRSRFLGWVYAGLAALVGFSVIYLGRHWIIDVPAGAAFALVIARVIARARPERLLLWPGRLART